MGNKNSKISFPTVPIKIKDVTLPLKKYIPPPNINKQDLRTSIGYIHDVISIIPPFKLLTIGITSIADLATNGKATNYLDDNKKVNHTIDFLPGGGLMQRIANDSSNGKSGQFIDRYTIDNKKIFVNNITTLASKKNISSDDIKKTLYDSILPPTTLQKIKRDIYSNSNSSNNSNSISNNSNRIIVDNNIHNDIQKKNSIVYDTTTTPFEVQNIDYSLNYIGLAFCSFIFFLIRS